MMSALQKSILDIIRAKIAEYGFAVLDKPQWANTGAIHVTLPGKFGTKVKVVYGFDDSTLTLAIYQTTNDEAVGVPSQPPRQGYFDHYMTYENEKGFATFLKHLDETLGETLGLLGIPEAR